MRIVQKIKGDPIEKAKLIVQIATLIERMTGEKPEPEKLTPREFLLGRDK